MRTNHALGGPCALAPLAPLAAAVALAWPAQSGAAEWAVRPGVDLIETYTDNLTLAPRGQERSDFITEIAPHLSVRGTGARMKLSADYVMRNFFYARESDAANTHHSLRAAANAELVDQLAFIDGTASVQRQPISPFGPQVAGSGNVTGNQSDVRAYSISPYLRHRFLHGATAELRYSRDAVTAAGGGLLDSYGSRYSIDLNSGSAFRTLQWGLRYDDQRIDYKSAEDVSTKAASGSLRYLLSPRVALTATAGYEDNSYVSIGPEPKGRFWTLGAAWTPSERTSVAASAGRRFFGKTLMLNAQHRTRLTVWSVAYEENLTTTRSQFLVPVAQDTAAFLSELWKNSIPDQVARNEQVQQFIHDANLPATVITPVNSFTNRVFLQRSAQASAAWRGAKNTLILSFFHIEREPESVPDVDRFLAAGIGALAGEATRQSGVGLQWNRHLGPRTSANAGASYSRVRSPATGRRDNDASATLGVTHQLQQKVHAGVQLRRLEKRSSQAGGEFRENAVAAFLQMNF